MTYTKLTVALVVILGFATGTAHADSVLDFEGLSTTTNAETLSSAGALTYGGLCWDTSWALVRESFFQGYHNNTSSFTSGDYGVFNAGGSLSVTSSCGTAFDFHGAYLLGWGKYDAVVDETSTTITIQGYLDSTLVGSVTSSLSASSMNWIEADLSNIDELRFIASGEQKWWIMDDFTYSPVPEPGTLVLMGLGLAGVAAVRRRRRSTS